MLLLLLPLAMFAQHWPRPFSLPLRPAALSSSGVLRAFIIIYLFSRLRRHVTRATQRQLRRVDSDCAARALRISNVSLGCARVDNNNKSNNKE